MRAAAYLRVSTDEQTFENQRPGIESFCQRQGWELTEVYAESESAWKAGHQRELARFLEDLQTGRRKYDRLVVAALDRLSRQGPGAVFILMDRLKSLGCQVVSLREPWVDSPFAEPMYLMIAWFAKWESESRSERTKAGLARARLHGTKSGIGIGKRGKDKNPNGRHRSGYLARWRINKGPPENGTPADVIQNRVDVVDR